MTKNILVSALVALVVGLGSAFFLVKGVDQSNVSGLSERNIVAQTVNVGQNNEFSATSKGVVTGNVLATTTPASMTLRALDVAGHSSISILQSGTAATITLPASTTLNALGFLPRVGERTSLAIINSTTTATNLTVAAGTGTLLQNASTSAVILPGKVGLFFITRKANGDYAFTFVPAI